MEDFELFEIDEDVLDELDAALARGEEVIIETLDGESLEDALRRQSEH